MESTTIMALPATRVNLELPAGAVIPKTGQTPLRLERKSAALLAYLALEWATPRSALAGLLWPGFAGNHRAR